MYLQAAKKLNDFLSGLVVSDEEFFGSGLNNVQSEKCFTDPLTGRRIFEHKGLLFLKNSSNSYILYDHGALWDPIEKRVSGDHYATSHYVLMCAALFKVTGETRYLARAKKSMTFCFRILRGYPRVPWGMHFDFNNYALALTLDLLRTSLENSVVQQYYALLCKASMNRHRTMNWVAQRVLYCDGILNSGCGHSWRHAVLSWLYRRRFVTGIAQDGSYEDHPGGSRPIQYHAFSLALDILLHSFRPKISDGQRLARGLEYLTRFIAPDGDFNFFGRGHRQIFAYSPALFALESFTESNPNLNELSGRVWGFVRRYQNHDGSFPLVLNDYPDCRKVGWYDYHRFSVYNAFFGAWLSLAQLVKQKATFKRTAIVTPKLVPTTEKTPCISIQNNNSYYICLSKGFSLYSSECSVSPHKFYFDGIGTIMSCPGGPTEGVMGFGNVNKFSFEPVNFFSPLPQDCQGNWSSPGKVITELEQVNKEVKFSLHYGGIHLKRIYFFEDDNVTVVDRVSVKQPELVKRLRLINLPLNIFDKQVTILGSKLKIESKGARGLMIDITPAFSLEKREIYNWVEGTVENYVAEVDPLQEFFTVTYKFFTL